MIEDTGIVDCCFILVECLCQKNMWWWHRFLMLYSSWHGRGDTRLK